MIAQGCRIAGQWCLAVGLAVLWGCAGTGRWYRSMCNRNNRSCRAGSPEPLKIVIETVRRFARDRSKSGNVPHLGGGVTNFNVSGGSPGVTVAEALAEALRWRRWNRQGWMPASCSQASRCQARIL